MRVSSFICLAFVVLMMVSLWHFSSSSLSVSVEQMTNHNVEEGPPLPRRPFDYRVLKTPEEIVQLIDLVVEGERDLHVVEKQLPLLNGTVNFFDLSKYSEFKERIKDILLPIAEALANQELEPTALYGVREYTHGATLGMHMDKRETHVYSFTITHDKDADWPIRVTDDTGKDYDLELEPGQMLYYVGADYEHGRPTAFEGESYINFYVHYKPADAFTII